MTTEQFEKRQEQLLTQFGKLETQALYKEIIEFGKNAPPLPPEFRSDDHLVDGCQSLLYLGMRGDRDQVQIYTESDALISAGLARMLSFLYDGLDVKTILTCKPTVLEELNLFALVSPNRANGLRNLYIQIQKRVLTFLKN
ncbi:MAG: Cysteine desulfuration protein SufE [Chlamydiia bacterium]|nr:Cysteine desulfuration protein SufE [Chlamydiia bacterium]